MNPRLIGFWLNIGSVAIMAVAPLLNKFALGTVAPSIAALIASGWALLFSGVLCIARKQSLALRRRDLPLFASGFASAVGTILLFESLARISPVLVGLIGRFYVVMSVLLAYFVLRERPAKSDWICGGLAIIGAAIFVPKGGGGTMLGVGFAIAYTFLFALSNTLAKTNLSRCSAESQLYITTLVTVLTLCAYVGIRGVTTSVPLRAVGLLAGSAFCGTFLGLWLFYQGLKYIDFYTANVIRTTSPVWVALFAWPFFPVPITWDFVVGSGLMLGSLLALGILKARRARAARSDASPSAAPLAQTAPLTASAAAK